MVHRPRWMPLTSSLVSRFINMCKTTKFKCLANLCNMKVKSPKIWKSLHLIRSSLILLWHPNSASNLMATTRLTITPSRLMMRWSTVRSICSLLVWAALKALIAMKTTTCWKAICASSMRRAIPKKEVWPLKLHRWCPITLRTKHKRHFSMGQRRATSSRWILVRLMKTMLSWLPS